MRNLTYLLLLLTLASCGASKHVTKQNTSIDSTVIKENQMLKEALEASSQTIEKLVKDSSGTTIVFESDSDWKARVLDSIAKNNTSIFGVGDPDGGGDGYSLVFGAKGKDFIIPIHSRNTVKFKDGKIVEASGNIKSATTSQTHTDQSRDSLQSLVYSYQDSLQKEQANKKVEIRTVEKVVKRFPWFWIILAFVAGAIGGAYLCYYIMERKKDRVYERST